MYKLKKYKWHKGKDIQKSTEVPKKVTFKKIYFPTELGQQIIVDEDATSGGVCSAK